MVTCLQGLALILQIQDLHSYYKISHHSASRYPCNQWSLTISRNYDDCKVRHIFFQFLLLSLIWQCRKWVHKKCSGVTKLLVADLNYVCPTGKGESQPIDGWTVMEVDVNSTNLDVEATFCYLGDMLCSDWGLNSAIAARCCVAWKMFRKIVPVLTTKHLWPRIRSKVYEVSVCSAMLHGSETWDQTPSASLLQKFGIEDITSVLRCWWLRWYGHV